MNHYLDHAATSPQSPEVTEAMAEALARAWANPSSPHALGDQARSLLEEARASLQAALGAPRVVFTSGATEANCLAVRGVLEASCWGSALALGTDHPSVLEPLALMKRRGREVGLLPVDRIGVARIEALAAALGPDLRLVCLLHGNNETGTLQPLEAILALLRERAPQAHLHVDWVQGAGRLPLDLARSGIDSLAISGHKIGGPRGTGCLALSDRARLAPLIPGGGQEGGLRGGTENVPGAVGLARALEWALAGHVQESERIACLRRRLLEGLQTACPEGRVNGPPQGGLVHILNYSFPGLPAEALARHLSAAGIQVGTGAACSGRGRGASHVLGAMGVPHAAGALRFSFGATSSAADVERLLEVLPPLVSRLVGLGRRR